MKKKEKKMILILVLISIVIIAIVFGVTRGKGSKDTTVQNADQGELTKVEADGTIVNTSEKLKEEKDQSGFTITNINFVKKGDETTLSARITNNTGADQGSFFGKIILLDKNGNELGRIPVMVSETKAGEAIDIEASITESYANAYDFKLEK